MNIACTACSARYGVADEKLIGKRVRITCKRCGTVLIVDGNYNPPTVSASTSMPPSPPASNRPANAPRTPAPAPEPPFMVVFADGRQEEADVAQIVRFHRAGQLGADSLVWRADLANWTDPWDVPQIAAAFRRMGYARPTPAPPPEPPPAAQPLRDAFEEEATQIHRSGPHHQAPLFDDGENTAVVDSSSRASAEPMRDPRVASRPVMEDDEVPTHVSTPTHARRPSAPAADQQRARRTHSEAPARASHTPARPAQASARPSQVPARASLPPLQRESADEEYQRARREAKARTTAQARSSRPPPGSANAQPRDLFARHSRAGSEEEEQGEQAEPAPYAAHDADAPRLTGARNENSVLFSLDSLLKQEKKSSAPPPPPRALHRDEALLTDNSPLMGGGIAPALAAPDFNAPITAPPPRFSTAAPVFAEDEMAFARPRSSRAWLYALVLLAFGGAGALGWKTGALRPLLSKLEGSPATTASATAAPEPAASAPRASESANTKPEAAPSATASASASASATATATAPGKPGPAAAPPPARAAGTSVARSTSASTGTASHKGSSESSEEAPAEKEAPSKETPSAAKEAPASSGASAPFDTAAAKEALAGATGNVASCKEMGGPTGNGRVSITFAPSGRPTSVAVTGDLAGTTVGSCIARLYRAVRVPAFAGDPVTVAKGFAVQ